MGKTMGWIVNSVAILWIAFETVLFSMPTTLPVTEVSMNYAIVVFFAFMAMSAIWYAIYARKGEFALLFLPRWSLFQADIDDFPSVQRSSGVRWSDRSELDPKWIMALRAILKDEDCDQKSH